MTLSFTYEALPMRVIFGAGRFQDLPNEVEHANLRRAVVLCTPGQRLLGERAAALIGGAAVFDRARMHVPVETVQAAGEAVTRLGTDGCVAVGGGSTIGLAKALALRYGLPFIAVPTTFAGSEMTPIWGTTEKSRKTTGRNLAVLPRSVVYDPELTMKLPSDVAAMSGMNAMAHAVEALYAPDASPITSLMAEEGVRSLAAGLPAVVADGTNVDAQATALRGAWLSGACLGATTMGLHHKLCHVLGGTFDLPHAATHAVMLPHVAAFTLQTEPQAREALARALANPSPVRALTDLGRQLGTPRSLAELGVTDSDLETVVEQVTSHTYSARHPVTGESLRKLLTSALRGDPTSDWGSD